MSNSRFLVERYYREKFNNPDLTYREVLRMFYVDKNMSIRDLSDEIGISVGSVQNDLKKYGVSKRVKCKS